MSFSRELREAVRIAREAGRIVLSVYASEFVVAEKGASDPVTDADVRANAYIVDELARLFPGDGIVAEETPVSHGASGKARCWYVDPLDGTKEFVAKNGEFSVMIGLAVDGAAKLGVVYRPEGHRLYAGVVGEGAVLEHGGERSPLRVSDEADPAKLRLVTSRSHRDPATDALRAALGIAHESAHGSVGLKIGLLAERRADLYVHFSNRSSLWDACAPDAILRAAGGVFVDLAGDAFAYGGADVRNHRGILACNAAAAPAILPVVADVAARAGLLACRA